MIENIWAIQWKGKAKTEMWGRNVLETLQELQGGWSAASVAEVQQELTLEM